MAININHIIPLISILLKKSVIFAVGPIDLRLLYSLKNLKKAFLKKKIIMRFTSTPPKIAEATSAATLKLLPEKFKKEYENAHERFLTCKDNEEVGDICENIVLAYVYERTVKSSTLLSEYLIMRAIIAVKNDINIINIKKYAKIIVFLKRKSTKYR